MNQSRWSAKISQYLLISAVAAYGVVFLAIVLARIRFPFELEWMEGSFLVQMQRVLNGQLLYTAPSLNYVPLVYTPLYFYLSAAVSRLVGGGFFPLRLVSLLSSLGCLVVIFLWVRKETGRGLAGLLAAGLFVACYNLSDTWFDLARVDMLFLFTLLLGAFCLRSARTYRASILAGVLFTLSFLTKQTALGFFLPLVLFAFWYGKKRYALALMATLLVLVGGSTLVFNALSGGWYGYYVFELPANHAFSLGFALYFIFKDMLPPFGFAWALILLYLAIFVNEFVGAKQENSRRESSFILFFSLVMFGASWATRANVGGEVNTLIPAYSALAVLFGLAAGRLLDSSSLTSLTHPMLSNLFLSMICLGQLLVLAYNPFAKIPSADDLAAGNQLVAAVRQIDGEVFIPAHNYIALLAGKQTYAHTVPIEELASFFGSHPETSQEPGILHDLEQAIQQQKFAAIILDNPDTVLFSQDPAGYWDAGSYSALEATDVFFSVSPFKPRTQLKILVPQNPSSTIQPGASSPADGVARLSLEQAGSLILSWYRQQKLDLNPQVTLPLKEMTTDEIWSRLGVQVFQVSGDIFMYDTFLVHRGQVTPMGTGFGGVGVTTLAVADLDRDGQSELLYTYSFGSGIHQSRLGIYSPTLPGEGILEASTTLTNGDLLLEKINDSQVQVKAELTGPSSVPIGQVVLQSQGGQETLALVLDKDLPQDILDNLKTVPGPASFYPTPTSHP